MDALHRFRFTVDSLSLTLERAPMVATNALLRLHVPDALCELAASIGGRNMPEDGQWTSEPASLQCGSTAALSASFDLEFVLPVVSLLDLIARGLQLVVDVVHEETYAASTTIGRASVPLAPLLNEVWVLGEATLWAMMLSPGSESSGAMEKVAMGTLGIRIALEDITPPSGALLPGTVLPPDFPRLPTASPAPELNPPILAASALRGGSRDGPLAGVSDKLDIDESEPSSSVPVPMPRPAPRSGTSNIPPPPSAAAHASKDAAGNDAPSPTDVPPDALAKSPSAARSPGDKRPTPAPEAEVQDSVEFEPRNSVPKPAPAMASATPAAEHAAHESVHLAAEATLMDLLPPNSSQAPTIEVTEASSDTPEATAAAQGDERLRSEAPCGQAIAETEGEEASAAPGSDVDAAQGRGQARADHPADYADDVGQVGQASPSRRETRQSKSPERLRDVPQHEQQVTVDTCGRGAEEVEQHPAHIADVPWQRAAVATTPQQEMDLSALGNELASVRAVIEQQKLEAQRAAAQAAAVWEAERWKARKEAQWQSEVVEKERAQMQALEDQWTARETRRQGEVAVVRARLHTLQTQILQNCADMSAREAVVQAVEESALRVREDLESAHSARVEEAQAAVTRVRAEFAHQLELERARRSDLETQRRAAEAELEDAKAEVRVVKAELQAAEAANEDGSADLAALRMDLEGVHKQITEAEARLAEEERSKADFAREVEALAAQLVTEQRSARETAHELQTLLLAHLRQGGDGGAAAAAASIPSSLSPLYESLTALRSPENAREKTGQERSGDRVSGSETLGQPEAGGVMQQRPTDTSQHSSPAVPPAQVGHADPSTSSRKSANAGLSGSVAAREPLDRNARAAEAQRLIRERAELLSSGSYTMDDILIQKVTRRIEQLTC